MIPGDNHVRNLEDAPGGSSSEHAVNSVVL
jgi:hypothetical protein